MLFLGETFEKIDKVTITNVFWGNNAYRKVRVEGYRLLEDIEIVLEKNSTVIVGRNNSGKTSFTSIFDCFVVSQEPVLGWKIFLVCLVRSF